MTGRTKSTWYRNEKKSLGVHLRQEIGNGQKGDGGDRKSALIRELTTLNPSPALLLPVST